MATHTSQSDHIKEQVRRRYGSIARQVQQGPSSSCCGPTAGCCSSPGTSSEIELFEDLYAADITKELPDTAVEASLGCGDPVAFAHLQAGETVLDLGSGGGIDCFIAAREVGPGGRVIGLDMTPEMIRLANVNKAKMNLNNVEFRQGEIENMPIEDASVDVIISNCVINLSPDKAAVFAEAFRVLKPGGRLAVSDIVTQGTLPDPLRRSVEAWAGCIAGALDEEDYLQKIRQAGFVDVRLEQRRAYGTDALKEYAPDAAKELLANLPAHEHLDYQIISAKVAARKPD